MTRTHCRAIALHKYTAVPLSCHEIIKALTIRKTRENVFGRVVEIINNYKLDVFHPSIQRFPDKHSDEEQKLNSGGSNIVRF